MPKMLLDTDTKSGKCFHTHTAAASAWTAPNKRTNKPLSSKTSPWTSTKTRSSTRRSAAPLPPQRRPDASRRLPNANPTPSHAAATPPQRSTLAAPRLYSNAARTSPALVSTPLYALLTTPAHRHIVPTPIYVSAMLPQRPASQCTHNYSPRTTKAQRRLARQEASQPIFGGLVGGIL